MDTFIYIYMYSFIYINVEVEVIKNETCISIMMKYVLMFWSSYHHIPNLSWSISLSVFSRSFPLKLCHLDQWSATRYGPF